MSEPMSDRSAALEPQAALSRRIGAVLLWSCPLAMVYFAFVLVRSKVELMMAGGFDILRWDDARRRALRMAVWVDVNSWFWAALAGFLVGTALLPARSKGFRFSKYLLLIGLFCGAFWVLSQGMWFSEALITHR